MQRDGGSPPAATQAVSGFMSPAKSAGAGSVRKTTILEASQEGKTGSQPSQRTGTGVSTGNAAAGGDGMVTSLPPLVDGSAAAAIDVNNDETQAPAHDMELEEAGCEGREQEPNAEQHSGDGPVEEAPKDNDAEDKSDEDAMQQELSPGEGSRQGDRPQSQEKDDGGAVDGGADSLAQGSHDVDAPMLEQTVAPGDDMRHNSGAIVAGNGGTSHSAADGKTQDSDPNSYYYAPGGQAQADTLVAPSTSAPSAGNSLGVN